MERLQDKNGEPNRFFGGKIGRIGSLLTCTYRYYLKESTELLNPKPGDVILDATINGGGHSEKILKAIGEKGKLIGIDQDGEVLNKLKEKWKGRKNILLARDNFRNLDKVLASLKIEKINGAIFDIGVSSSQIDESGRGFSFQKDEPLLMTMKDEIEPEDLTAKEIVNGWTEKIWPTPSGNTARKDSAGKSPKTSSEEGKRRRLRRHWSWLMR